MSYLHKDNEVVAQGSVPAQYPEGRAALVGRSHVEGGLPGEDPIRDRDDLAAATGLRLALVDFLLHASRTQGSHLAWHARGRSAVARLAARWLARHLPPGLSPEMSRELGKTLSQGAVARLVNGRGGAYIIRRSASSGWDLVDEADYSRFRAEVAKRGETLTLVFADSSNHEMTVTRTKGGLLHGADTSCPAMLRVGRSGRQAWYYDKGTDVTARVVRHEGLAAGPLPPVPPEGPKGGPRVG